MSGKENILDPLTWQTSLPVKKITQLADVNGLTMGNMLGKGAFGEVTRGTMMMDGKEQEVAIKTIKIETKSSGLQTMKQEIENMYKVSKQCSANVVQIYDVLMIGPNLYIVMELVDGVELAKQKFYDDAELVPVLKQLMSGLRCFQEQGLAHADVKPQNVMYDPKTGVAKWIDFGLMCPIDKTVASACKGFRGTPNYVAPELWQQRGAINWLACDVWSFGVLVYVIMTRKDLPFQVAMYTAFKSKTKWPTFDINTILKTIPATFPVATSIMQLCLIVDPVVRMKAFDAIVDNNVTKQLGNLSVKSASTTTPPAINDVVVEPPIPIDRFKEVVELLDGVQNGTTEFKKFSPPKAFITKCIPYNKGAIIYVVNTGWIGMVFSKPSRCFVYKNGTFIDTRRKITYSNQIPEKYERFVESMKEVADETTFDTKNDNEADSYVAVTKWLGFTNGYHIFCYHDNETIQAIWEDENTKESIIVTYNDDGFTFGESKGLRRITTPLDDNTEKRINTMRKVLNSSAQ